MTQITLTGTTVELLPLQRAHKAALLEAAADGELWNLKVTHVPGPTPSINTSTPPWRAATLAP